MSSLRDIDEYYLRMAYQARDQREAAEIMRRYQEERAYYRLQSLMSAAMVPAAMSEPSNAKPLPEEHLVAAITGFRAWNVPLFVDELRSVAKPSKWLPYRRFEAKCEAQQCAGVSCTCGIYAFSRMELVTKEYRGEGKSRKYVYGEVSLWGRVLECKDGYRAQFAYPKAFVNSGAIAKRMSEVFGVPLLKPL
jgi:hypothetical protein